MFGQFPANISYNPVSKSNYLSMCMVLIAIVLSNNRNNIKINRVCVLEQDSNNNRKFHFPFSMKY